MNRFTAAAGQTSKSVLDGCGIWSELLGRLSRGVGALEHRAPPSTSLAAMLTLLGWSLSNWSPA